jgi:hypothetical protein
MEATWLGRVQGVWAEVACRRCVAAVWGGAEGRVRPEVLLVVAALELIGAQGVWPEVVRELAGAWVPYGVARRAG